TLPRGNAVCRRSRVGRGKAENRSAPVFSPVSDLSSFPPPSRFTPLAGPSLMEGPRLSRLTGAGTQLAAVLRPTIFHSAPTPPLVQKLTLGCHGHAVTQKNTTFTPRVSDLSSRGAKRRRDPQNQST